MMGPRVILAALCLCSAAGAIAQTSDTPATTAQSQITAQETAKAQEDAIFAQAVEAINERDYAKGFQIFQTLAQADVADAQYNLAVLYNAGLGRPVNYRESAYWASLAHLQGIAKAQPLATRTKENLTEDAQKHLANRLQQKLADDIEAGKPKAAHQMAELTYKMMPEPDLETAYVWYSICNALGIKPCSAGVKEVGSQLEADQILKAQQRASEVFDSSPYAKAMQ